MKDDDLKNFYVVVFENDGVISIKADSKEEAAEKALEGLIKITGKPKEELFSVKEVLYYH